MRFMHEVCQTLGSVWAPSKTEDDVIDGKMNTGLLVEPAEGKKYRRLSDDSLGHNNSEASSAVSVKLYAMPRIPAWPEYPTMERKKVSPVLLAAGYLDVETLT
jgi:hypothetical protein